MQLLPRSLHGSWLLDFLKPLAQVGWEMRFGMLDITGCLLTASKHSKSKEAYFLALGRRTMIAGFTATEQPVPQASFYMQQRHELPDAVFPTATSHPRPSICFPSA
jgi:hypothetical protein